MFSNGLTRATSSVKNCDDYASLDYAEMAYNFKLLKLLFIF
ncbi:hypothetical protein D3OALGA1CA_2240 [Olavius algarvensis associated proteobacterium Delta 3]|nr:hypothetical protein D3OALGA1CA_2240 [Olavius algarvensis associated proteobacterium Delta 3]CAB5165762.1 hypothetical protein D3OALGB2SA_5743 [Olavius algarvensis associated proteobacterium Delta 3]